MEMPLVLVALSEEQQAGAAQSPQELWMVWMVWMVWMAKN